MPGAARFDFDIRLGMGSCGHDTSHQFAERLLIHVEEHGANGWRDCVHCCGSHSGYMLQDVCRGSSLHGAVHSSESSSANSSDKLNTPQLAGHSRIVKSASVAFTDNSALQVCLSRLQADKVRSCRWQSHAGRELPQQEGRRPKDRSVQEGG